MELNKKVRAYWELEPCGTNPEIVGKLTPLSREWFEKIEMFRYEVEPYIHSIAQFTRHHGKRILEVGIGAGTDHLQWARAGAECHGVDLTDAAIETTRARLECFGLSSRLQRVDVELLPFPDNHFDIVYSWGVIHHAERPEAIVAEIRRVLRPGGQFIGMFYGRRSLCALRFWVRNALLKGRPWRSFSDVIWHQMESVGTKAYTCSELRQMFGAFSGFTAMPILTEYDTIYWPMWISQFFPDAWGWFIAVRATK